ncbi:ABC transporter permease [Paenibacillus sp. M1]|uniref:ABC transporter permease n=1 Tax=Paenibacillus haidiansis TaxID=1574488 RepID=A0ABU7VKL4_9BACL
MTPITFRKFAFSHVLRNKRTYAAYFLSSAFSVMIFFVCALFLFHPGLRSQVAWNSALLVLAEAEVIMFVFCFLFVLYSVGSFLRSRKREFGLLLMHGMTVTQLRKMIFLENMLVGAGALGTGIAAGLLTAKLFLLAGAELLGIDPLPFHVSFYSLLLTVFAFLLLFLVISLCTTLLLGSTRPIDLLQSGAKRDTSPKPSKVQALLAAVLLLASYGLAATASASEVEARMLPVILMTIAGTYLFFTQASVVLLGFIKRNLTRYWRKSNLILVSNLSYRMKDNARILFIVTIISTVTFCAIGMFASINRLSGEFALDYPSEIGYVAKDGSGAEEEHLAKISAELAAKGIHFRTEKMDLVFVDAVSDRPDAKRETLPLIAFSDYRRMVQAAGFPFEEQAPRNNEALVLISSERERPLLRERKPAVYLLGEQGMRLHEAGITGHVAIPEYLLPELGANGGGTFSGLVVGDGLLERLDQVDRIESYTAFYADRLEGTAGIAEDLADNGKMAYNRGAPYALTVSGTLYEVQRTTFGALLFFALLVGTVFFIAAGSFLYFRLYSDLDADRRQYAALTKLGMTGKEMNRVVTVQLALLFFLPIGVAMLHSLFAFIALQSFLYISIAWEAGIILTSFCLVQIVYFLFIRARYLRNLHKTDH